MDSYKPTIGLEVHAELKTASKMFCGSKNDPDNAAPNTHVCPVCMGHPGTLPVINKEAVRHVVRIGTALGCEIADYTEFDRKNYFYPDLPKGYQISQYKYPLVSGGELAGVQLTRIHLEEDAARSAHDTKTDATLVDYNRASVPLMELVSEPVITSAQQAAEFARELQLVLRYLGAGDANMEKGQMRIDANVSVSNTDEFGKKVEIKNLNSFRAVEKAIEYEISRQVEILKKGDKIVQETRGWDDNRQETFSQRIKEESADYRYFPDPDIPHLRLSEVPEFEHSQIAATLPELPRDRRDRYITMGLKRDDAELFVRDVNLGAFFDAVISVADSNDEVVRRAANYIGSDVQKMLRDAQGESEGETVGPIAIDPQHFAMVMQMTITGDLSSRGAKDLLPLMFSDSRSPEIIAKEKGLLQSTDTGALEAIVDQVLSEQTAAVAEYKAGKVQAVQFLIGQCMKASKGAGNPGVFREILIQKLA